MIDNVLLHVKNVFRGGGGLTHFHCSRYYLASNSEILRWKFIVSEIEGHHAGEDANHGVITEGINAKDVEVPQEAGRHSIPPTARRAHS